MLGDCFLWKGWISTLRCLRILVSSESWPIYHSFIKDEKSSWWSWFEKIPEVRFQGKVVGCIFKLPDVYNSFFGLFYRMQFAHCTSYKGKRVHQWFEHYTILHLHTLQKEAKVGWIWGMFLFALRVQGASWTSMYDLPLFFDVCVSG